jgi:hypothetical protein
LEKFNLGIYYSDDQLGVVSTNIHVEGTGIEVSNMDLNFEGDISELGLGEYVYTKMTSSGRFKNNFFSGKFEIADANGTTQYSFNQAVINNVEIGTFTVKNGVIVERQINKALTAQGLSQDKWGVKTETFAKVQTVMFSPNYWDENDVGNKHWFFILEGCKNPEPTRGIYNEFLAGRLDKHRKVFEILGDKTKCPVTDQQLSGLGFSSTRGDAVMVCVKAGRAQKYYNLKF